MPDLWLQGEWLRYLSTPVGFVLLLMILFSGTVRRVRQHIPLPFIGLQTIPQVPSTPPLAVPTIRPYTQSTINAVQFSGLWDNTRQAVSPDPYLIVVFAVTNGSPATMNVNELVGERPVVDGIRCTSAPRLPGPRSFNGMGNNFHVDIEQPIAVGVAQNIIDKLIRGEVITFSFQNVRFIIEYLDDGFRFPMNTCDSDFEIDPAPNDINAGNPTAQIRVPRLYGTGPSRLS